MNIANLQVFNTSSKNGRPDRLRVLRDGAVIAELEMRRRNPLGWIRKHRDSEEAMGFEEQLTEAGVDDATIDRIMEAVPAPTKTATSITQQAMARLAKDPLSAAWFGLQA